jgi:hypothetical protein
MRCSGCGAENRVAQGSATHVASRSTKPHLHLLLQAQPARLTFELTFKVSDRN